MYINKNLTTVNYNTGSGVGRIKYIVIHYTANNGDTAYGNTNYFKSVNRNASAHYFVDEKSIWQCVEDKDIAWHCGTSGTYFHKYCRNSNSIGVELCSYINSKGQYDFRQETVDNAVWLVKQLMDKYKVCVENVLRHFDVTHKRCPEPFVRDEIRWRNFTARLTLQEKIKMSEKTNLNINGKIYSADRILENDSNFINIRSFEQAGFKVGYDPVTKIPSIENKLEKIPVIACGILGNLEGVNINGTNVVTIRSLAALLGYTVDYIDGNIIITKQ